MLVAISQRNDENKHGKRMDSLENEYVSYFKKLGITLIPIPNNYEEIEDYFTKYLLKGIILSGGNNINPKRYNSSKKDTEISDERDLTEEKLLDFALRKKIPVLGICRGSQFINIYFGGNLIQSINEDIGKKINHINSVHELEITNSELKKLIGEKINVNSFHNKGINNKTISEDLSSFAKSQDGLIEGIYHKNLPIAGIFWHPERESPNESANKEIIKAFANRKLFWSKK